MEKIKKTMDSIFRSHPDLAERLDALGAENLCEALLRVEDPPLMMKGVTILLGLREMVDMPHQDAKYVGDIQQAEILFLSLFNEAVEMVRQGAQCKHNRDMNGGCSWCGDPSF